MTKIDLDLLDEIVIGRPNEKDWTGMPKMAVEFSLAASDKAERDRAIELVHLVGRTLGEFLPGRPAAHIEIAAKAQRIDGLGGDVPSSSRWRRARLAFSCWSSLMS